MDILEKEKLVGWLETGFSRPLKPMEEVGFDVTGNREPFRIPGVDVKLCVFSQTARFIQSKKGSRVSGKSVWHFTGWVGGRGVWRQESQHVPFFLGSLSAGVNRTSAGQGVTRQVQRESAWTQMDTGRRGRWEGMGFTGIQIWVGTLIPNFSDSTS